MSLFVSPWATSCATSYWRLVTDAPGTDRSGDSPRKLRTACAMAVRVADVGKVIAAGQHVQSRARDSGGERPSLLERCRPVMVAMQHEGGGLDVREQVGDVDVVGEGEHCARDLRRRGLTLVPGERRPGRGIGVGGEDVGQHVRAKAPMLRDQSEDVLAHRPQPRCRLRVPTPRRGPTARRELDAPPSTRRPPRHPMTHRTGRTAKRRPPGRQRRGSPSPVPSTEPAPRPRTAHSPPCRNGPRCAPAPATRTTRARRHRPTQLQMGEPSRRMHQNRPAPHHRIRNPRTVGQPRRGDPLVHNPILPRGVGRPARKGGLSVGEAVSRAGVITKRVTHCSGSKECGCFMANWWSKSIPCRGAS